MDLNITNVSSVKRVGKEKSEEKSSGSRFQQIDSKKMSSTCFFTLEINGSSEVNCRKQRQLIFGDDIQNRLRKNLENVAFKIFAQK